MKQQLADAKSRMDEMTKLTTSQKKRLQSQGERQTKINRALQSINKDIQAKSLQSYGEQNATSTQGSKKIRRGKDGIEIYHLILKKFLMIKFFQ